MQPRHSQVYAFLEVTVKPLFLFHSHRIYELYGTEHQWTYTFHVPRSSHPAPLLDLSSCSGMLWHLKLFGVLSASTHNTRRPPLKRRCHCRLIPGHPISNGYCNRCRRRCCRAIAYTRQRNAVALPSHDHAIPCHTAATLLPLSLIHI